MVALYLAVSTKDPIYMAVTAAMAIAVVAVFLSYSGSRKKVYELMDDDDPKSLEMDEDSVTYTSGDKTLRYSWDEILCVALNKRSIVFFPKSLKNEAFFVDAKYKEKCAGIIHTDFEKGFIKAEVISYNDLIEYGSELKVKEAGKARLEGKDYIMQDGDICHFRFNV